MFQRNLKHYDPDSVDCPKLLVHIILDIWVLVTQISSDGLLHLFCFFGISLYMTWPHCKYAVHLRHLFAPLFVFEMRVYRCACGDEICPSENKCFAPWEEGEHFGKLVCCSHLESLSWFFQGT